MSDDNIISMLTAETLRPADSAGFASSDVVFQRRRGLSKMPVHAVDGEFLTPQIARFNLHGEVIDLPVTFSVGHFLEGMGGVVTKKEDRAFFDAISALVGGDMDCVYVVKASEGNPWLVFWNESEGEGVAEQIMDLFHPRLRLLAKAA